MLTTTIYRITKYHDQHLERNKRFSHHILSQHSATGAANPIDTRLRCRNPPTRRLAVRSSRPEDSHTSFSKLKASSADSTVECCRFSISQRSSCDPRNHPRPSSPQDRFPTGCAMATLIPVSNPDILRPAAKSLDYQALFSPRVPFRIPT
jgi:hypothetical protein